ncbi:hypothetical protein AB688_18515 [Pseudomonas putida]|uniref:hypothetical protein n=1 Tax=Pseudomonas putida TaxID=303 RepID=UPI0007B6B88A|nr:hypothetical protein [Pseudomonas putida]ANC03996.1 hypothetical protein AB688_18515 [Pseudomonas putida]
MSNTEMVSAPFHREGRYIVIKLSDLAKVPPAVGRPFTEQLTAIQRRLPERECLVIESDWPEYGPAWAAIEARVTGEPAQHHGEPVALPDRKLHVHQGLSHTDAKADGWNACLDEIAKLGLLYAHSDPDEVERLRASEDKWYQDSVNLTVERDALRAQLAERDALLIESHDLLNSGHLAAASTYARQRAYSLIDKIKAVTSANAEPEVKP